MNIVFDLDGTLIDSASDIQSVANTILNKEGKPPLTLDEARCFIGEGAAVFVRRMMAARQIRDTKHRHAELLEAFMTQYEHWVHQARFYPGVPEALADLQAAGHRLGLCTNKPEKPARAVLRHMGLDGVFDAIMAGGMINSRKPEPDMLLQVINSLGGSSTLYVGDSEVDAETAQRAKVSFALFAQGYRKTPITAMYYDWVFYDYAVLPGIVARL